MKPLKLTPLVPTEWQEQCAVVAWWNRYAPTKGLDSRLLIASANGARLAGDRATRARQMNRLKSSGLRVGVPDLFLAVVRKFRATEVLFSGLFVEMKRTDAPKPSEEQLGMADLLRRQGYNCVVAWGADEAIRAIKGYVE